MLKKPLMLSGIGLTAFTATSNILEMYEEDEGEITTLMKEQPEIKVEEKKPKMVEAKIKGVDENALRNEDICDTDCLQPKMQDYVNTPINIDDFEDPE